MPVVRRRAAQRLAALGLVGAATATLTGCGSGHAASPVPNGIESRAPRTILDTAYTNARAQTTVHVSGSGRCPQGPFVADLRLTRSGGAVGSISFPPDKLDVVVQGDALYVRGPAAFWAANLPAGAPSVGTRWVRSTNTHDNPCVRALTSYSALLANFLQLSDPVTENGTGVVLGKPVVTLETKEATVFVTTTGTPLPVRVDSLQQVDVGTAQDGMSFGEWNAPVAVALPATDQVVDAATLVGPGTVKPS